MFYVGQKVVCVDASFPGCEITPQDKKLVEGQIYTIFSLEFHEEPGVHLVEIEREKCVIVKRRLPYSCRRFRPVTDISALQAIVAEVKTGKPRKIRADRFDKERV